MTRDHRRVLVVEDDAATRALLVEALADEGYEVRAAARGDEGLAPLKDWRPAAVVLDVVLPGLDAVEFRALQMDVPAARDVPVLLLSATHAQTLDRIAADVGAAAWLAKPFEVDEFLGAVARLVDR